MIKPFHGSSNYQGPGVYKHYKGGSYDVIGLAVKEDTVDKENTREDSIEIVGQVLVVYKPLTSGSLLPRLVSMDEGMSSAKVEYWAREINDFNQLVQINYNHATRRFVRDVNAW